MGFICISYRVRVSPCQLCLCCLVGVHAPSFCKSGKNKLICIFLMHLTCNKRHQAVCDLKGYCNLTNPSSSALHMVTSCLLWKPFFSINLWSLQQVCQKREQVALFIHTCTTHILIMQSCSKFWNPSVKDMHHVHLGTCVYLSSIHLRLCLNRYFKDKLLLPLWQAQELKKCR